MMRSISDILLTERTRIDTRLKVQSSSLALFGELALSGLSALDFHNLNWINLIL